MENSRKTYEAATKHLVTFLDQVSSALALSSPTKKTQFGSNILDRDTSKFNRKTPIRVKSRRSMRSGRVSGSIDSFPCLTPGSLPPLMLVNKTPVCSSSPLQSLMEDQQCNMSATTEDDIRMSSPQSVHKLLQSSHKRCSPRSVSSAADCSPRDREAWRADSGAQRRQPGGSPAWRHIGDCTSHSQAESMESGKDSGRASDTSSSGRSTPPTPHKERFSMVCGRTSRRTETRQQLAARASRLVASIRQLLAMENKNVDKKGKRPKKGHLGNDAPFNTRLPGSLCPWILRPHNLTVHPVSEPPKARPFSACGDQKSRVELVCPDTEYSVWRHAEHPEQENGADDSLSPRTKILRSQSEKLVIPKSIKPPKTSLRTCSFLQSTPKKCGTSVTLDTWPYEDTLIKINSMGVVSVPVPYPVHCHPDKSKGNILWV